MIDKEYIESSHFDNENQTATPKPSELPADELTTFNAFEGEYSYKTKKMKITEVKYVREQN